MPEGLEKAGNVLDKLLRVIFIFMSYLMYDINSDIKEISHETNKIDRIEHAVNENTEWRNQRTMAIENFYADRLRKIVREEIEIALKDK